MQTAPETARPVTNLGGLETLLRQLLQPSIKLISAPPTVVVNCRPLADLLQTFCRPFADLLQILGP